MVEKCLCFSEPTTCTMKLGNLHPALPSLMLASIRVVPHPVPANISCCILFVVIGKVEVNVNPVPDRLPYLCPAGIINLMLGLVSPLLTPSPSV